MQVAEKQVFVRRSAALPNQLRVERIIAHDNWGVLAGDADAVEKQVRAANWHFFWITSEARGWAIADSKEAAADAALRKALRRIDRSCNAAEVVSLQHRSWCGLHFCQVRLRIRHIQQEVVLRNIAIRESDLSGIYTGEKTGSRNVFERDSRTTFHSIPETT